MEEMMRLLKKYGFKPRVTDRCSYGGSITLEEPGAEIVFEFDSPTTMFIAISIDAFGARFDGALPLQKHCIFCEEGYLVKNDEHSVFTDGRWMIMRCQK